MLNLSQQANNSASWPQLYRLIREAKRASQFVTLERLAEQAIELAQSAGELPLLVAGRFWLADALRMQNRVADALSIFVWMIEQATDPATSRLLTDTPSRWYLTRAFVDFAECGRQLPQIPVDRLYDVLDDGLTWLDTINMARWSSGLRYERGLLLSRQRRFPEARQELEIAVALARRNPNSPGYTVVDCQMSLAELLIDDDVAAYTEGVAIAEAALANPAIIATTWDRLRVYGVLALGYADLGDYARAMEAAQERMALARTTEGPRAINAAFGTLFYVYYHAGDAVAAVETATRRWFLTHSAGLPILQSGALRTCLSARILQARLAFGLPPKGDELPADVAVPADLERARHYVDSARRFMRRFEPWVQRWDDAAGTHTLADQLAKQAALLDTLDALIVRSARGMDDQAPSDSTPNHAKGTP
jgi:tetratricopeptide (TPR) repeat protein